MEEKKHNLPAAVAYRVADFHHYLEMIRKLTRISIFGVLIKSVVAPLCNQLKYLCNKLMCLKDSILFMKQLIPVCSSNHYPSMTVINNDDAGLVVLDYNMIV